MWLCVEHCYGLGCQNGMKCVAVCGTCYGLGCQNGMKCVAVCGTCYGFGCQNEEQLLNTLYDEGQDTEDLEF